MKPKELIQMLTPENIKYIMRELGADNCIDHQDQGHIIFPTICHSGSKHKLYYYTDSKSFHCYTNCGYLSVYDVIMQTRNWSFYQAKMFIHNLLGIEADSNFQEYVDYVTDDLELLNNLLDTENIKIKELQVYDDTVMNLFSKTYYQGWIEEGITVETMKKFNICFYGVQQAIVIPHYNVNGELIGIRKRALDPIEIANGQKYMPMLIEGKWYTHPLQYNLYGLNINKETIEKTKKIIIVESEKGVMQLDSMYPNGSMAVALSSSNLSNFQRDMIIDLGVTEVIFALDKQYQKKHTEEYAKYQKKIMKMAKKFTNFTDVSIMWDTKDLLDYKDSPTDKGKEVFEELFKTRIPILN